MPEYSLTQLNALKDSELVKAPEFVWNEIEAVPAGTHFPEHSTWRRGSHGGKRQPPVMPKAAIPFSQKSLFDTGSAAERNEADEAVEGEADDDEYAARFLLRSKQKPVKKSATVDEDGAQVVNLSYAAALAATMKMSDAQNTSEEAAGAADDDDGWVSVANKPRRNRNKGGSFSKWRSS